ncbi:hypothetical protein [Shimia abyssi]|uniref:Uncharacterized protein n=1 Tax=Shimia abyssi TaxID=1662395 RepID=A0A2P8FGT3_9RHOB|nr:hypothetical protein [Shimia abyssi]PSL20909.1 hypothetical protein CLV88_10226 [Shimia abyssi]
MKINLISFFSYLLVQTAFAVLLFFWMVDHRPSNIIDQFWGHFSMGGGLVIVGGLAILSAGHIGFYNRCEAWGMIIFATIYILADTFIMHPPFGVFDGAGHAEQEHVSLMGTFLVIGISGLVMMHKFGEDTSLAINVIVAFAVLAMVFLNHHQHTVTGTAAHNATILFLSVAAVLRLFKRQTEFGIAMVVSGWIFFSSQMGFAHFVDMSGNSPGAWIALFSIFGFVSAMGFVLMSPGAGQVEKAVEAA